MAPNTVRNHLNNTNIRLNNMNVRLDKSDELGRNMSQLLNLIIKEPDIKKKLEEDVEFRELAEKLDKKCSEIVNDGNTAPNINNTGAAEPVPNINNTCADEPVSNGYALIDQIKNALKRYFTYEGLVNIMVSMAVLYMLKELISILWNVVCVSANCVGVAICAVACVNPITTGIVIGTAVVVMLTSWLIYSSSSSDSNK